MAERAFAEQHDKTAAVLDEETAAKKAIQKHDSLFGASVQRRVGAAVLKVGFQVHDVSRRWDANGDGEIDKEEVGRGGGASNTARGCS